MKKQVIIRFCVGGLNGIAISNIFALVISLMIGDGVFYMVNPNLIDTFHGELNAVIVQMFASILIGGVFGASSLIWEMESWSLLKMTVVHCVVISLTMFPIAWILEWMSHTIMGAVIYVGIFFVIYGAIWLSTYFISKRQVEALNDRVKNTNK